MGVYVYKTKPSHIATALIALDDGSQIETEIALYQYAYKPYSWDDAANVKMRFSTGVVACENAYARSGKAVPKFGLTIASDGQVHESTPALFATDGSVDIFDDYVKYSAKVVKFLKLPKGIKNAPFEQMMA